MKGFIAYEGPSVLDGAPIVAIVTLETKNPKTGNMAQLWIMRSDIEPHQAVKTGDDSSVCGACPHRHHLGGSCYVVPHHGPLSIFRAYKRGVYAEWQQGNRRVRHLLDSLANRKLRLGAYGDPAAVPVSVLGDLCDAADSHTGYTHQSRHPAFDVDVLDLCMVSADTPKQAAKVQAMGLRTFRVKTEDSPLLPGEIECPADGDKVTCATCGLCDGTDYVSGDDRPSVAINVHGSRSKRYVEKYGRINVATVA